MSSRRRLGLLVLLVAIGLGGMLGTLYWLEPASGSDWQTLVLVCVPTFLVARCATLLHAFFRQDSRELLVPTVVASTFVGTIVIGFANIYRALGLYDPSGSTVTDATSCLYFSIVTWTTLGYGDLRPSESARLAAAAEAMLGYVAMAVFIGLLLAQATKRAPSESAQ